MSLCLVMSTYILLIFLALNTDALPSRYAKNSADVTAQWTRPTSLPENIATGIIEDIQAITENSSFTPLSSLERGIECRPAHVSGQLNCDDKSGNADVMIAAQVCEAHDQTLYVYIPADQYNPSGDNSKTYWICAKNQEITTQTYEVVATESPIQTTTPISTTYSVKCERLPDSPLLHCEDLVGVNWQQAVNICLAHNRQIYFPVGTGNIASKYKTNNWICLAQLQ